MDRQALVAQPLAGQDQMFGFLPHAPDPARARRAPHRDEGEGLAADAQVLLVHGAALVGAHRLHPGQVARPQEGLRGSVTAPVELDVILPLVLVQRLGSAGADVAFDERVEAVVPSGELARGVVLSRRGTSHEETGGEGEQSPEGSHHAAGLRDKQCDTSPLSPIQLSFTSYLFCFTPPSNKQRAQKSSAQLGVSSGVQP